MKLTSILQGMNNGECMGTNEEEMGLDAEIEPLINPAVCTSSGTQDISSDSNYCRHLAYVANK